HPIRGLICRGQFCEHDPPPLPLIAAGRWVGSGQLLPTLLTQRWSPRTLSVSGVTVPDRAGSLSPHQLLPIYGRSKPSPCLTFEFERRSLAYVTFDIESRTKTVSAAADEK